MQIGPWKFMLRSPCSLLGVAVSFLHSQYVGIIACHFIKTSRIWFMLPLQTRIAMKVLRQPRCDEEVEQEVLCPSLPSCKIPNYDLASSLNHLIMQHFLIFCFYPCGISLTSKTLLAIDSQLTVKETQLMETVCVVILFKLRYFSWVDKANTNASDNYLNLISACQHNTVTQPS